MDLDLLQIKLTAYALGELEAVQKTDIERILTESQDARDQVARAKNIAKAIKELLPQSAEDVQPMTPAEYRARRPAAGGASMPAPFPDDLSGTPDASAAAPPPVAQASAPAQAGGNLVWLLAAVCVVLAAGWLWQWKNAAPSPQAKTPAAETETQAGRIKALTEDLQKGKDDLEKERALRAETEAKNAALEKAKEELAASVSGLEDEKNAAEAEASLLERRLARTQSGATARHHPFVPTSAQLVASVPATGRNDTLARIQSALQDGEWPLPDLVDAGELVQSFGYHYPAPPPGQNLPALGTALAACPWNEGHVLARVTLTAGAEPLQLASLQVEFNPAKVAAWRVVGRETEDGAGGVAGGQGCGELKPGASLTLLCEILPASDPLTPLLARRIDLLQKIEDAKHAVAAAKDQTSLTEAKLAADGLRLDLQDLDAQITKTKGAQKPAWRYLAPPQPTAAAAMGDWLAVTGSVVPASGQPSAIEGVLRGAAQPFPEADADFRLAASAAALGLVLRESPERGSADLKLVESLVKDLPKDNEGAKTLSALAAQAAACADAEDAPRKDKDEEPLP